MGVVVVTTPTVICYTGDCFYTSHLVSHLQISEAGIVTAV